MADAMDAVVEIFTWVGVGAGAFFAGLALIAYLIDGTWVPVRGYVEEERDGPVLRWFDEDGGVNEARISPAEWHDLGGTDTVDVFARRGSAHRMRKSRRSPAVRAFVTLAGVLLGVGVAALVVSAVLLFARG